MAALPMAALLMAALLMVVAWLLHDSARAPTSAEAQQQVCKIYAR
jgi:hypothetical protein